MRYQFPSIKASKNVHYHGAIILIVIGCLFMVQTYPLVWLLIGFCSVLFIPAATEIAGLLVLIAGLIINVIAVLFGQKKQSFANPSGLQRRKITLKTLRYFSKLPLRAYNIYDVFIASNLVDIANEMGMKAAPIGYNPLLCDAMVPLYEQASTILESNKLADRADLVLVKTMLARQLHDSGDSNGAIQKLQKAVEIFQQMSEKEKNDAAQTALLLADCHLILPEADKAAGNNLATDVLLGIENLPVGTNPTLQLILLAYAIKLVARMAQEIGDIDKAKGLNERYAALSAALRTKGVAV